MKSVRFWMWVGLVLCFAARGMAAPPGGVASARDRLGALSLSRLSGPEAEGAWILVTSPQSILDRVYDDLVLLESEIGVAADGDRLGARLRSRARKVVKFSFSHYWRCSFSNGGAGGEYSDVFADTIIDACLLPLELPGDMGSRVVLARQVAVRYFDLAVDSAVTGGMESRIVVPGTMQQASTEWTEGEKEARFLFNYEDRRGLLKRNRLSWALVTVNLETLTPTHRTGLYKDGMPLGGRASP